jgi:hypothetical protein
VSSRRGLPKEIEFEQPVIKKRPAAGIQENAVRQLKEPVASCRGHQARQKAEAFAVACSVRTRTLPGYPTGGFSGVDHITMRHALTGKVRTFECRAAVSSWIIEHDYIAGIPLTPLV